MRSPLQETIADIHNQVYDETLGRNKRFSKYPFRYKNKKINYHNLREFSDLKDLHAYRRRFIPLVFQVLTDFYPESEFSDAGSTNITSDIDAMAFGPYKEEMKQDFNLSFEGFFNQDSSSLLDVNVYDVQMISLSDTQENCRPPFVTSPVKMAKDPEAPKYICRLDLRDDPEVRVDQRAWAFVKLLLYASEHEKKLLFLLENVYPDTFHRDITLARRYLQVYKRPKSVMSQNRLYEKASMDLRVLRERLVANPDNLALQREYVHQGSVATYYAQDAYFTVGTLADVVFLQQMQVQGYDLTITEYVDSVIENFGDLCKAVHLDHHMMCGAAVVDVSKYLFRTIHALDMVYDLEWGSHSPFGNIEEKTKKVKETVRGKITEAKQVKHAAEDIMKAVNIPDKCNINELREKTFLLLFSMLVFMYKHNY